MGWTTVECTIDNWQIWCLADEKCSSNIIYRCCPQDCSTPLLQLALPRTALPNWWLWNGLLHCKDIRYGPGAKSVMYNVWMRTHESGRKLRISRLSKLTAREMATYAWPLWHQISLVSYKCAMQLNWHKIYVPSTKILARSILTRSSVWPLYFISLWARIRKQEERFDSLLAFMDSKCPCQDQGDLIPSCFRLASWLFTR